MIIIATNYETINNISIAFQTWDNRHTGRPNTMALLFLLCLCSSDWSAGHYFDKVTWELTTFIISFAV